MNASAIVYTSNSGHTAQYARLLAGETGLPVYDLAQAERQLARGSTVLYLGWLMAGKVKGYSRAAKLYRVEALCGVGMGSSGSQLQDLRKANKLPAQMPLFTLQGGFDLQKLHGLYKLMMTTMSKTAGKRLAARKDRSPEENDMLDLLIHGGNRVSAENLAEVLKWCKAD